MSRRPQPVLVSGVVVDAQGQPIPDASVIVKGTAAGTMTDIDGKFTISVRPGTTLVVSCIGYATVEVAARNHVHVVLEDDVEFLDEAVVVGFGTQKKANLTGAVTAVDADKVFGSKPVTDMSKGLQGVVPGLTITYNTNDLDVSQSKSAAVKWTKCSFRPMNSQASLARWSIRKRGFHQP